MNEAIPFVTPEQCIHHRFDDIAGLFPNRPAVSDGEITLTYAELQRESNKLANRIIELLGQGDGNIALFIENNCFQIISILGIVKSGRAYVSLDTSFPNDRNISIVQDAASKMLISTGSQKKQAKIIGEGLDCLWVDKLPEGITEDLVETTVLPGSNAITLYTSGSSGKPKGVLQSHRNMLHFIKRMSEEHNWLPSDRVPYYLSVGFSAHALPLLGALLNGGELVTYNFTAGNFHGFSQWLRNEKISCMMTIPSFMRHFLAVQGKHDEYPALRLLYFGGETLYRSDVEKARKVFAKGMTMVNIYASTEAYIMRSFSIGHNTIIKSNIVPIGYPVQDMKITLADENGNPVSGHNIGEIILESEYLTEGYHQQPDLQEKDFSVSADGKRRIFKTSDMGYHLDEDCIVHSGRKDAVIKLRGFRVDFGEIINILLGDKKVKEAYSSLKTNPQGIDHIIAYAVPADNTSLNLKHLHDMMVRLLPGYMIPSHIIELDELPKNASGKIDHTTLPEPTWTEDIIENEEPPEGETEMDVSDIFTHTLKIPFISRKASLLELGADSLGLFVAFAEIEKKFGVKLDIQKLLETPNIKSIAASIEKSRQL